MAVRNWFGALAERRFRLLWLGQATSELGNAVMPIALPFSVIALTGSATDLGLVLAAALVPRLLLLLVGGVWADRLPRQLVMLACDLVRAASQGAFAVLLLTGHARLWHLLVAAFVYGTAQAFFNPALTGLVPETVSAARLQQANALLGLTRNGVRIAGPVVAGVVVAVASPGWLFSVDATTFAVSGVFLALLGVRGGARMTAIRGRFVAELAGGWRELTARTWVWASVVFFAIANFAYAPVYVLGPLVAERDLGGAGAWGVVLAAAAAGSIAGSVGALHARPRRPLVAGYVALAVLAAIPAALVRPLPTAVVALAAALGLAGLSFSNALWETALQQHVPREALSRVSAYDWMGSHVFLPLGYALAGVAASAIGLETTLWTMAGLLAGSTVVILAVPSVRELRGRGREPAPREQPPPAFAKRRVA